MRFKNSNGKGKNLLALALFTPQTEMAVLA